MHKDYTFADLTIAHIRDLFHTESHYYLGIPGPLFTEINLDHGMDS